MTGKPLIAKNQGKSNCANLGHNNLDPVMILGGHISRKDGANIQLLSRVYERHSEDDMPRSRGMQVPICCSYDSWIIRYH